jgi:outer membrane protein OmpA-like peptidoglycan-associated protein
MQLSAPTKPQGMKHVYLILICLGLSFAGYAQQKKTGKSTKGKQAGAKATNAKTKKSSAAAPQRKQDLIQWASAVVEVSSEKSHKLYSAEKAVGTPNAMPQGGDNPNAWEPLEGKNEFIHVRFDKPAHAAMVVVLENYMPGAITKITAYDSSGEAHVLATYGATAIKEKARILTIEMPRTQYSINSIRIDINTKRVSDNPQIDAVGIADKVFPVELIHLPPDLDVRSAPERLSNDVNSPTSELGPVISSDGQVLYFSRAYHPNNVGGSDDLEDIYYSTAGKEGTWSAATNMGSPLNNEEANFVSSVTPDGNALLLGNIYANKGDMRAGASISYRLGDADFSVPKSLTIRNDQNYSEQVDFVLSNSGNILIISEERENSIGHRDLYVSFLQDDSTWSEPKSLGPVVNTASDEFSPFLAADDRSLYFATTGRPGFGNADIFLCRRIGDSWQEWTEPQNLGSPINGPGKDSYFTLPASGNYAYYTAPGLGKDETDIFRIKLPQSARPKPVVLVSGTVVDSKSKKPIDAEIVYEDLSTGKKVGTARTNPKTGKYQIALPGGQNFGYLAKSKESESFGVSSNLNLEELDEYKEVKQDLEVAKQEVGAVVRLNNLFFDFEKSDLKPESFPELMRMVAYLKKFPKLTLEIAGHTDSVGAEALNLRLSGARSKSVVEYLVKKGITANRLKVRAYGESKPQESNATEEGRAINRRVEFVVLEKGTN